MKNNNIAADLLIRLFVICGTLGAIFICLALCNGCTTKVIYRDKPVFVDMETYKTWGTTKLKPLGTRGIPERLRRCNDIEAMYNATCPRHLRE